MDKKTISTIFSNQDVFTIDLHSGTMFYKTSLGMRMQKFSTRDGGYRKFQKNIDNLEIKDFTLYSPENYMLRKYESDSLTENLGVNGEGLLRMLEKLHKENKLAEIKENLTLIDWFDDFEIVNDAFRGIFKRIHWRTS